MTGDLERLVEETRMQNLHFQAALDNMSQGLCLLDAEGRLTVANRRFLHIYGLSADAGTSGRPMAEILGESAVLPCPRGYVALTSARETLTLHGRTLRITGVHIDVTERKEVERRLAAAERLESIGRLAAGVAHEINTPVQFVSENVQFMRTSMAEIHAVIQTYRGLQRAARRRR